MKIRLVAILGMILFCAVLVQPALAQQGVSQTQTTAHYKITVDIGPLAPMLMPDQAKGATSGEVMVQIPGQPMPAMSMTDQGQPVNHHLEVHIWDSASGNVVTDMLPTISITDPSGSSRTVSPVTLMYDVQVGASDSHFGNNVYLPDGAYTVTVTVNDETATFTDLAVSGGAAMAMSGSPTPEAMAMTSETPTTEAMAMAETPTVQAAAASTNPTPAPTLVATLPTTGGAPSDSIWLWALGGMVLAGAGLVLFRVARSRA